MLQISISAQKIYNTLCYRALAGMWKWTQTRRIFFPRHLQPWLSNSMRTISKGFQSVSTFERVSKRFKVPEIGSNILRNKSALVVGIRATFTCFQHLRPRKRGFLHETGNSIDFDYLESRQKRWYTYILTTEYLKWSWYWRRKPRLVTYSTEISLLRSLVAPQQ